MKMAFLFAMIVTAMFYGCKNPQTSKIKNKSTIVYQCCNAEGTCSGDKYCTACKNCKYCKNCSKNGGTCGVCK